MINTKYAVLAASTVLLLVISVPDLWYINARADDSESTDGSSGDQQSTDGSSGGQSSGHSGDGLAGKIILRGGCYLILKSPSCLLP